MAELNLECTRLGCRIAGPHQHGATEQQRSPCPRADEHGEHGWAAPAEGGVPVPYWCPGLREIPLTAAGEPHPHAQCALREPHPAHGWRSGELHGLRWCRGSEQQAPLNPAYEAVLPPYQGDAADVLTLEIELTPVRLAEVIDGSCTPDFKVTMVRALMRLDPALRSELTGDAL